MVAVGTGAEDMETPDQTKCTQGPVYLYLVNAISGAGFEKGFYTDPHKTAA